MSSDLKAEAVIELETSSLEASSKKVKKEFDEVGKSATKGGAKADKALDKTGVKATKIAGKLKETGAAGKKAGDDVALGANKGARALDQMGTSADGADNSMETLSTSMIGLAQTATGVSDAIFGLAASLVGLEKTKFGIIGMEIAIERMEEGLIVAIKEGTLSTLELTRASEDLAFAQINLGLESKQVAADTQALDGQMVTLAINIGAAIAQSAIMVKTLLVMRGVKVAVTASTIAETGATVANTGVTAIDTVGKGANTKATIGQTIANWSLVGSLRAAAAAMKVFMLSNPVTAVALIATTAAVIAYESNLGGLRDGIEDLTGQERGSLPTLGGAFDSLGGNVEDTITDMENFRAETQDVIDRFTDGEGFNPTIIEASENVDALGEALKGTSNLLFTESNALNRNTNALQNNSNAVDENLKKNKDFKDFAVAFPEILGFRGETFEFGGQTFRSRITAKEAAVLGGDTINAIRTFNAKSQGNFADSDFASGGGFTAGSGNTSRKRQQLEARNNATKVKQQTANELNAYFGNNIFQVKHFTTSSPSRVTPTAAGRQILTALGLTVDTAQLLLDAQVNLDHFFGTDVSYPILGTTRKNVTIHNGRVVQRVSHDVIVGSTTVTSGSTGQGRLAALSLAAAFAREKIAEKEESERIIEHFASGGSFGDIANVQGAVSFLSESFGVESERSINDRIRFLERTEKELLLTTTV